MGQKIQEKEIVKQKFIAAVHSYFASLQTHNFSLSLKPQPNKEPYIAGTDRLSAPAILLPFFRLQVHMRLAEGHFVYQIYHRSPHSTDSGRVQEETLMAFFNSAITVLQTLVIALGAGLGIWGAINLLEGYGNDNPGAKPQGMKQFMAN